MADALLTLPINGNQKTIQESTYTTEMILEINAIKYQGKDPVLMAKHITCEYKSGSFSWRK